MKILLWISIGLGISILLIMICLGIIIFTPVLSETKEAFSEDMNQTDINRPSPENRESISIKVGNDIVKAWLYLPQNHQLPVPCVILSNGFGGIKDGLLEIFALRYSQEGMASINYDYRHFGESSGEPRQYYNKAAQLEDLKAVIAYARSRKEIDGNEIAEDNIFLEISNTRYTGTSFLIAPAAKLDDGLFDVTILRKLPKLRLLRLFPTIYSGAHVKFEEVSTCTASKVKIMMPKHRLLAPDGELHGETPATVTCLRQDMEVYSRQGMP